MRLFTVGPVEMFERTLEVRNKQIPYFRCQEFSDVMLEIEERLKILLKTDIDSKCAIITGSGSAAMEAVVSNSLDESDHVLVIDGGSFGARFVQLCEIYKIPHDVVKLKYGEILSEEHLKAYEANEYTAMLVNVHETSTGQLYDLKMLSEFCEKKKMKLIVDAISSFLSDEYKMDEMKIDCTIISSHKALALAPGLSMVMMNASFYEEKVKNKPVKNLYLNLNEHVKNMERGQTPNTPAVGICYEMLDMLRHIQEKGIQNIIRETSARATKFRSKIKEIGLEIPNYPLSNTLTPVYFKDGNAFEIYEYLKNNYDIYVTPSGGALKDKLLRVGHIGHMKDEYYDDLIMKMREVL
ncbi:aspartate aminotransferase-like enzyme [Breznakia sp. PF5-3]|uniref:pyridoxal-phosphate-dependent aminotransferase family protein n=1 Tax=unclassified Breznakia TaxID=2623764 RepID=UPI0024067A05|nr:MULTISPECIES: aminotransferase class V-fold PLP-dependent enzyme [unclassified Breznakia]MDF9824696.1 aspartate aminotransferase-like enzyme [Breznakia sp. PM6-1]MDF9835359.1 aspartate aminotransferase-like enzyme [Breznakia sp. PF5-3]MDF9836958.1 aspartate aminotransferase-like enzyme [Breznakia sp. PFB2-8]MDF9859594.1 aspartate aminotransferase-like enzyme [Breznakia sp. PH5-24]